MEKMKIKEVQSTTKKQRVATHAHIKGLGLEKKVCQVCGGGGAISENLIVTCTRCLESHEHVYCMKVLRRGLPTDQWICESCMPGNEATVESGAKEDKAVPSFQLHFAPRKHLKPTGKVKFIGQDEVIRLASGSATSASPTRCEYSSLSRKLFFPNRLQKPTASLPRHAFTAPSFTKVPTSLRSARSPVREKAIADIYSAPRSAEANVSPIASPPTRPIRPGNETLGTSSQKANKASSDFPLHVTPTPSNDTVLPTYAAKLSQDAIQEADKTLSPQIPSSDVTLNVTPGINAALQNEISSDPHCGAQLEDLPSVKLIISLYGAYRPSLHGTWKGGVSIVDASSRSEIFIEGFQAQAPSQVHCKVYRVLQKFPPILQVKMISRAKYLDDICLDADLDLDHVGLYFFPSDIAADTSRYNKLFERMEMEESVMACRVDEYELTIFTSKQLKVNKEMNNFLWGLVKKASKGKLIVYSPGTREIEN